ncbi:MAG TPA: hypothetical protein VIF60_15245 [Burkholderiaceae bacterium]|jgi:hypothetical protein
MQNVDEGEEFAVEYTDKERRRILIPGFILGALVVIVGKNWISPWFREFVDTAHCRSFFGYSGTEILFYGIFVGLPCLAILSLLNLTWTGAKIVRDKQAPPKGMKVFRKTKIIRGKLALCKGLFLLLIVPVLGIPFATWGYFQAREIVEAMKGKRIAQPACREKGLATDTRSNDLH